MASEPPMVKPTYVYIEIQGESDGVPFEIRQAFSFPLVDSQLIAARDDHEVEYTPGLGHDVAVPHPVPVDFSMKIRNAMPADPPYKPKQFKRAKCPVCGYNGSITGLGIMWPHNDRRGVKPEDAGRFGFRCPGSGKAGLPTP